MLSGSNTYNGGTNINGGVLQFANSAAVPLVPQSVYKSITINSAGALSAISGFATTVNGWLAYPNLTSNLGAIALTPDSTDTDVDFTMFGGFPTLSLGAVGNVTYGGTIEPAATGYLLGGGGGALVVTTQLTGANNLAVGNGGGGTVILTNSADNWSGPTTIIAGGALVLGDSVANTILPLNTVSNSGSLTILNLTPGTINSSNAINGPGELNAFGTSVLELDGSNSAGIFYANGGTVNIGNPSDSPSATTFKTTGKTILGTNLASAPRGPVVVNWNATGTFTPTTGGNYWGVADTGQVATFNMMGGSLNVVGAQVFFGNGQGPAAPAVGTLNMTDGTISVDATNRFDLGGRGGTNISGTGVLNISGGSMYIAQGGTFGAGQNDSVTMAYGNDCTGIINLTGGTLSTARTFYMGGGTNSTAILNLNGGVLQCAINSTGNWFYNGVAVVAGTNGAFLDVETGQTAKVANGTGTSVTISGPGALTKLGPGLLDF